MTAPLDYDRHDLRRACLHEGAHCIVARYFGIQAHAHVEPTGTDDPMNYKAWVGRTSLFMIADACQRRLIGLAGTVAEELDCNPNADAIDLFDSLESGTIFLSDTDSNLVGPYTDDDVAQCMALVRELWHLILNECELMMNQARELSA